MTVIYLLILFCKPRRWCSHAAIIYLSSSSSAELSLISFSFILQSLFCLDWKIFAMALLPVKKRDPTDLDSKLKNELRMSFFWMTPTEIVLKSLKNMAFQSAMPYTQVWWKDPHYEGKGQIVVDLCASLVFCCCFSLHWPIQKYSSMLTHFQIAIIPDRFLKAFYSL